MQEEIYEVIVDQARKRERERRERGRRERREREEREKETGESEEREAGLEVCVCIGERWDLIRLSTTAIVYLEPPNKDNFVRYINFNISSKNKGGVSHCNY